jgi:hypothetical protein
VSPPAAEACTFGADYDIEAALANFDPDDLKRCTLLRQEPPRL